jgi:hypothetical protein
MFIERASVGYTAAVWDRTFLGGASAESCAQDGLDVVKEIAARSRNMVVPCRIRVFIVRKV